jgi:hypothetical protein
VTLVVACEGGGACEVRNASGLIEEVRDGQEITRADGSTMNPHGGTVHHGGEKQKSVRFMASRWGRCALEAEGGRRAPILCGGRGERGGEGGCR